MCASCCRCCHIVRTPRHCSPTPFGSTATYKYCTANESVLSPVASCHEPLLPRPPPFSTSASKATRFPQVNMFWCRPQARNDPEFTAGVCCFKADNDQDFAVIEVVYTVCKGSTPFACLREQINVLIYNTKYSSLHRSSTFLFPLSSFSIVCAREHQHDSSSHF